MSKLPIFSSPSFSFGLVIIAFLAIYYLLQRQISQRRQAQLSLRQQTERERLVNQIAQDIRQSLNLEEVLATTVADVRQFLLTDRVLIYRLWEDGTGSAITEAVSPEYPVILGRIFPPEVFPQEYHQAYIQGKSRAITDLNAEEVEPCLVEFVSEFGVKAKLVVPIIQEIRELAATETNRSIPPPDTSGPHLWGLLIAHHCRSPRKWQPLEIDLMKQLATQVAIAIQQSELYEQLQQLNGELEVRVQQRTEELAKTNEALRQSEECFRSLIENALDIITILAPDGTIHYENPFVEKVLGYSPQELIGQNFFGYIHPDDLAHLYSVLSQATAKSEETRPIEFRRRHQDGHWRTFEALPKALSFAQTVGPLIDGDPLPKIFINSRDITERKRLDEVRLALEREKELNALKTRFFSMVSHEFRTPLSTVLAAAQLLETSTTAWENPEKRERNLGRIQDSVKNMVQLLDDILTINRAETGHLEFNPQWFDLEQFCRNFVEEMQLSAGIQQTLTFVCWGEKTAAYLDKKLLRSILANLLSNAIKYSPTGGKVQCSLTFEKERVQLQIRDRGLGIPPDDQKQLFEPFSRGKNVRHLAGTGLGLVVVKKCVDLHEGSIEIVSEPGKGTIVTVLLPLVN